MNPKEAQKFLATLKAQGSAPGKDNPKEAVGGESILVNIYCSHSLVRNSKEPVCRICLEKFPVDLLSMGKDEVVFTTEQMQDSEICQPCQCTGSIKYVHIACLKVSILGDNKE